MPKLATNIGKIFGSQPAKKHADPLRADPAMAKLLDERDAIQSKITEARGVVSQRADIQAKLAGLKNSALTNDNRVTLEKQYQDQLKNIAEKEKSLKQLETDLDNVSDKLEEAQKALNKNGVSPQALRPEYKDEEKKSGWHTGDKRERITAESEDKDYPIRLSKWQNELQALIDRKPKPQNGPDAEYQVYLKQFEAEKAKFLALKRSNEPKKRTAETDAEWQDYLKKYEIARESTLKLTKHFTQEERDNSKVDFDEQGRAVGKTTMNDDGTVSGETGPLNAGKVDFVMSKSGQMHQFGQEKVKVTGKGINPITGKEMDTTASTHHSSVLSGEEVAAAGEMELDLQGYIVKINNKSGHYKPGATQVIQLLERLAKDGALLDKNYVMPDPNDPEGKAIALAGKPQEIYNLMNSLEAGLKGKIAAAKDIRPELAAIEQGKQALAKLGVAPANKFRPVEVGFLDGAAKKTGLEVKNTQGTKSTAEEFLKTGGGNQKQAELKKKMQAEVQTRAKEILGDKLEKAEKNAEALAEKVSEDMAKTIKELPEMFKHYQEEFAAALKDESEEGRKKRKELVATLLKIEAAANMEKTLEDLKGLYEKDKAAPDPVAAWDKDVEEFADKELSWDDYGGKEAVAAKLGIDVENLPDIAGSGAKPFSLTEDGFAGCNSDEELFAKLTGREKPSSKEEQDWKKELAEFEGNSLDWAKYGGKDKALADLGVSPEDWDSIAAELDDPTPTSVLYKTKEFGGCTTEEELFVKLTGKKKPGE